MRSVPATDVIVESHSHQCVGFQDIYISHSHGGGGATKYGATSETNRIWQCYIPYVVPVSAEVNPQEHLMCAILLSHSPRIVWQLSGPDSTISLASIHSPNASFSKAITSRPTGILCKHAIALFRSEVATGPPSTHPTMAWPFKATCCAQRISSTCRAAMLAISALVLPLNT